MVKYIVPAAGIILDPKMCGDRIKTFCTPKIHTIKKSSFFKRIKVGKILVDIGLDPKKHLCEETSTMCEQHS